MIEGPKWCGKATALQVAKSVLKMDDPKDRIDNINAAQMNPSLLLAEM